MRVSASRHGRGRFLTATDCGRITMTASDEFDRWVLGRLARELMDVGTERLARVLDEWAPEEFKAERPDDDATEGGAT